MGTVYMYSWFADLRFLFYETILLVKGGDSGRYIRHLNVNRVLSDTTNLLGVLIQDWW